MFGPETFVERVGGDALVRLMAAESGRSGLPAANPGRPDLKVTRANETMIRGVVVLVGRREAQRPVTTGRWPEAAEVVFRGMSPGGGEPVVTGR